MTAVIAAAALAACATDYPTRFVTNGVEVTLTDDEAARLRKHWKEPTDELLRASSTSSHDRRWTLNVIAHRYANAAPSSRRCNELVLSGVRRLPLDEIHNRTSAGTIEVLRPVYYAELWQVEACGRRETWRALGLWGTIDVAQVPD